MVNIKKRIYIFGSIILTLVLLGVALLIWDLVGASGKQQDKVYSGAKLVYNIEENPFCSNDFSK